MTKPEENRRKHLRIYRNYIISYYLKGKRGLKFDVSQVNNISKGGINFTAVMPFSAGTELGIEVKTPFLSDKLELEGRVLGSVEKIQGMLYEIRVRFDSLSPHAEEILTKIEQFAAQKK